MISSSPQCDKTPIERCTSLKRYPEFKMRASAKEVLRDGKGLAESELHREMQKSQQNVPNLSMQ